MEGKPVCPFCGAELRSKLHYPLYECGTWESAEDHELIRKDSCYERQLATLQAQVEGMNGTLNWVMSSDFYATGRLQRDKKLRALLSPTPAGEWVSVRREDLEMILVSYGSPYKEFQDEDDSYNRLKKPPSARAGRSRGWKLKSYTVYPGGRRQRKVRKLWPNSPNSTPTSGI